MNKPQAYISINNNRIKQYGDTVYLKDGTDFQLEFNNPTSDKYLAKISHNGKEEKSGLILRPGEHTYIDRFMDIDRKLTFDTYDVPEENFEAADKNNGEIVIKFYKEKQYDRLGDLKKMLDDGFKDRHPIQPWQPDPQPYQPMWYSGNTGNLPNLQSAGDSGSLTVKGSTISCDVNSVTLTSNQARSKSVETGRVERGKKSDQQFHKVVGDFKDVYSTKVRLKIMPQSHKPKTAPIRRYCTECGSKIKQKWKHCAHCGEKL